MSNCTQSLPGQSSVRQLLSSLFGDGISVEAREEPASLKGKNVIAAFNDGDNATRRIIACDLDFACKAGAALTMFPAGMADDAIKSGDVPENLLENLSEVLNICVNLFAESSATRLVLGDVVGPTDSNRSELESLTTSSIVSFDVEIPRYGKGVFSLAHIEK